MFGILRIEHDENEGVWRAFSRMLRPEQSVTEVPRRIGNVNFLEVRALCGDKSRARVVQAAERALMRRRVYRVVTPDDFSFTGRGALVLAPVDTRELARGLAPYILEAEAAARGIAPAELGVTVCAVGVTPQVLRFLQKAAAAARYVRIAVPNGAPRAAELLMRDYGVAAAAAFPEGTQELAFVFSETKFPEDTRPESVINLTRAPVDGMQPYQVCPDALGACGALAPGEFSDGQRRQILAALCMENRGNFDTLLENAQSFGLDNDNLDAYNGNNANTAGDANETIMNV